VKAGPLSACLVEGNSGSLIPSRIAHTAPLAGILVTDYPEAQPKDSEEPGRGARTEAERGASLVVPRIQPDTIYAAIRRIMRYNCEVSLISYGACTRSAHGPAVRGICGEAVEDNGALDAFCLRSRGGKCLRSRCWRLRNCRGNCLRSRCGGCKRGSGSRDGEHAHRSGHEYHCDCELEDSSFEHLFSSPFTCTKPVLVKPGAWNLLALPRQARGQAQNTRRALWHIYPMHGKRMGLIYFVPNKPAIKRC
jgi:hypothetical protein